MNPPLGEESTCRVHRQHGPGHTSGYVRPRVPPGLFPRYEIPHSIFPRAIVERCVHRFLRESSGELQGSFFRNQSHRDPYLVENDELIYSVHELHRGALLGAGGALGDCQVLA